MNRENKRKLYEKGYYKNHPCDEVFTCRVCGRTVVPEGAGSSRRQSDEADEHCHEAAVRAAFPDRADRGAYRPDGRRGNGKVILWDCSANCSPFF